MIGETNEAMMQALEGAKLDAEMRAMAENAMQHFASLSAEPSAAQILAEGKAESEADGSGGGGGMDAGGAFAAPVAPEYQPKSPFRLKFTFGSDGSYTGATMEDPNFLWTDSDGVTMKTAAVGSLSLNGTVYLNVTLDSDGKYSSASVGMSSSGDMSVKLYVLSNGKVMKDYRHALISLCEPGGGGGVTPDDVSTEFIPDAPQGTTPDGDEGKLQIKGFKSGTITDNHTIAEYISGAESLPASDVKLLARWTDTNGDLHVLYIPLAALWGDGSSGSLPAPEVTYLDDVAWDASNHQLVKLWVTKNLVTGAETPVQGAPQGKTATIDTTAISTILGS